MFHIFSSKLIKPQQTDIIEALACSFTMDFSE